MIRENRVKALISSLVIFIPVIIGLLLWNDFPDSIVTHWGADGSADGVGGKFFVVAGIPAILFALHWICLLITLRDPKNKEQNKKALGAVFWIMPIVSMFSCGVIYCAAFGKTINMELFIPAVFGVMFTVMGNYLPKVKQNHTLGIRIIWTVKNEENWNKTHRLAGKLWVSGGLLLIFSIFLPTEIMIGIMAAVIGILAVAPIVYSYCLYRKQVQNGAYVPFDQTHSKSAAIAGKSSFLIVIIILAAVTAVLFTGNIEVKYGEKSFKIEASYWGDLEIEYAAVDNIAYREDCSTGIRTNGFGSPRLSMGTFENDEFGSYTRYTYTGCKACVVIESNGKTFVISGKGTEETKNIYNQLVNRIG